MQTITQDTLNGYIIGLLMFTVPYLLGRLLFNLNHYQNGKAQEKKDLEHRGEINREDTTDLRGGLQGGQNEVPDENVYEAISIEENSDLGMYYPRDTSDYIGKFPDLDESIFDLELTLLLIENDIKKPNE